MAQQTPATFEPDPPAPEPLALEALPDLPDSLRNRIVDADMTVQHLRLAMEAVWLMVNGLAALPGFETKPRQELVEQAVAIITDNAAEDEE